MIRALERGSTRWLVLACALVGFGFLAKMLQAFLVLPGFGLVYLLAAPAAAAAAHRAARRRRRSRCSSSAGWWVAIVELSPASVAPVHRRLAEQQLPRT